MDSGKVRADRDDNHGSWEAEKFENDMSGEKWLDILRLIDCHS